MKMNGILMAFSMAGLILSGCTHGGASIEPRDLSIANVDYRNTLVHLVDSDFLLSQKIDGFYDDDTLQAVISFDATPYEELNKELQKGIEEIQLESDDTQKLNERILKLEEHYLPLIEKEKANYEEELRLVSEALNQVKELAVKFYNNHFDNIEAVRNSVITAIDTNIRQSLSLLISLGEERDIEGKIDLKELLEQVHQGEVSSEMELDEDVLNVPIISEELGILGYVFFNVCLDQITLEKQLSLSFSLATEEERDVYEGLNPIVTFSDELNS